MWWRKKPDACVWKKISILLLYVLYMLKYFSGFLFISRCFLQHMSFSLIEKEPEMAMERYSLKMYLITPGFFFQTFYQKWQQRSEMREATRHMRRLRNLTLDNVFVCQVSYWEVVNIYRIICIMARPCALCSTQGITGMWPNSCLNLHYLWNVENISDDFWSNSHTAPLWLTKIYVGNFTALWNEDAVNVSVLTVCPFFPSRKFSNKKNFSLWQICN